jgi:hypothetical protein
VVVNIALWLWILAAGVLALVLFEVVLRMQFGLGTPPLYVADARTGYRLAPNQSLRRRGNRIDINQYSMRGDPIDSQRQPDTFRILLLGDSIVNGGGGLTRSPFCPSWCRMPWFLKFLYRTRSSKC